MHSSPVLLDPHQDLIRASAIADPIARERGYRSITDPAELAAFGFADYQRRVPCLLVPLWSPGGQRTLVQIRPDEPRSDRKKSGKYIKYETPAGAQMRLDVPPRSRQHLRDPQVDLWVTEGVRKADSGVSNGLPCIIALLGVENWRGTNEHGGKTALGEWADIALNGRTIVIAYDSDVTTKPEVRRALEELAAWLRARGAKAVRYCLLPPGPHGEKTGLDDFFARGGTREALVRCIVDTLPPLSIPPAPFPLDTLPGVFRAMVEEVSVAQDVDPGFAALPLLAVAGALIGGRTVLELVPGWSEPAILWTVVIAPSSAGKTPAADAMIAPVAVAERLALDDYQRQWEEYERNLEDWQALSKDKRAQVAKPTRPTMARTLTDDPTLEALALLLKASPGVLYDAGEISTWLAGFDRYRQGKGGDRGRWLKLWQHHLWTPDRKTAQTVYVPRPHVTLTGGIQPRRLGAFARDLESGDGMFPRFLYGFPESRIPDPTNQGVDPSIAAAYATALLTLRKESPAPVTGGLRASDQYVVRLSSTARERWQEWRWDLTERRRDPALLDSALGEYLGKLPAHCARLALVLHALADPRDYHRHDVSVATLEGAIRLAEYFAAHAQHVLRHIQRDNGPALLVAEPPLLSEQRLAIIDVLHAAPTPLSPLQIAELTRFTPLAVRSLLHDMLRDKQVERVSRGHYHANDGNNGNNAPMTTADKGIGVSAVQQQASNIAIRSGNNAPGMMPDAEDVAVPAADRHQSIAAPPLEKAGNVADVADVAVSMESPHPARRIISVEV